MNRDRYWHHFKLRYSAVTGDSIALPNTDDDWGTLGRHYGLIAPILDWTECPYVAAYFALVDSAQWTCDKSLSEDEENRRRTERRWVVVWRLNTNDLPAADLLVVDRWVDSARQRAQKARFTRIMDFEHRDLIQLLRARKCLDRLVAILIAAPNREAFDDLHDELGIHHGTLFPDEFGAAMYANLREIVKPETLGEITGDPRWR